LLPLAEKVIDLLSLTPLISVHGTLAPRCIAHPNDFSTSLDRAISALTVLVKSAQIDEIDFRGNTTNQPNAIAARRIFAGACDDSRDVLAVSVGVPTPQSFPTLQKNQKLN